jgi:hypothetical protein
MSSGEAALFGHVDVYNLGADVTAHCYVELTDEAGERQRYLSLDKTGWIFASVKPGTTYLSFVSCTVTDGTTFNVQHQTRELSFAVPGSGRIAYFGHVLVEFDQQGQNLLEAAFTPTPLVDYGERAPGPYVEVYDRFGEAVREYNARYGKAAAHLQPSLALLPLTLKKQPTPVPAPAKSAESAARSADDPDAGTATDVGAQNR